VLLRRNSIQEVFKGYYFDKNSSTNMTTKPMESVPIGKELDFEKRIENPENKSNNS